jgi:hypothetical protein
MDRAAKVAAPVVYGSSTYGIVGRKASRRRQRRLQPARQLPVCASQPLRCCREVTQPLTHSLLLLLLYYVQVAAAAGTRQDANASTDSRQQAQARGRMYLYEQQQPQQQQPPQYPSGGLGVQVHTMGGGLY